MMTRRIFIAVTSLCLLLIGLNAAAQEGRIVRETVYSLHRQESVMVHHQFAEKKGFA